MSNLGYLYGTEHDFDNKDNRHVVPTNKEGCGSVSMYTFVLTAQDQSFWEYNHIIFILEQLRLGCAAKK